MVFSQQVEEKKAKEVAKKVSPLEGQWQVIEMWDGEKKVKESLTKPIRMEFNGERARLMPGNKVIQGKLIFDDKAGRMFMAWDEKKEDERIPAIYKVEGDVLTFCHFKDFAKDRTKFPESFEAKDGFSLVKLKRVPVEKKLEGKWLVVGLNVDGEELEDWGEAIMRFENGHLFTNRGESKVKPARCVFDVSTTPKRIVIAERDDDEGDRAIYKLEGKKLILAITEQQVVVDKAVIEEQKKWRDKEGYPKDFEARKGVVIMKLEKMMGAVEEKKK